MVGDPPRHRESLERRLRRQGLTFLCVAPRPTERVRPPAPQRAKVPRAWLYVVALGALMVVLLVVGRALLSPLHRSSAAYVPDPPRTVRLTARSSAVLATIQNTDDLAQIIMSEASPGVANAVESIAVGYTVRNRMQRQGSSSVRDVWDAYAHHAAPSQEARTLAAKVLRGALPDPSGGATHFYSPRSMPMEGELLRGFDTGGGLEHTPGLPRQNYRPGWAAQYDGVDIVGVRATHYKFYRSPVPALGE
jgi:hypothetical protein